MSVTAINFKGSPVIIYNENGDVLLRSTVIEYIKSEMLLIVMGDVPNCRNGESISILILLADGVYEFTGTRGRVVSSTTYIALSKGRPKEGRGSKRYQINQPGTIESLLIAGRKMKMSNPVNIHVINISASGVLFSCAPKFNLGAHLEYKFQTGGSFIVMPARVVRMKYVSADVVQYACHFDNQHV